MGKPDRKNRERERKRKIKEAQIAKEQSSIDDFRKMGKLLKPALRHVGCDLPFYEYLDSYTDEFARLATEAVQCIPSLRSVHEVHAQEMEKTDWTKYGVSPDHMVSVEVDDKFSDYGKGDLRRTNMSGGTSYFLEGNGRFCSIILVQKNVQYTYEHPELKYEIKIPTLLHEIGHAHDAEQCLNVDPLGRRFDVVEAEIHAHCYALTRLAARHLVQSYSVYYSAIEGMIANGGYESEIAKGVLERHPKKNLRPWNDFLDAAWELLDSA